MPITPEQAQQELRRRAAIAELERRKGGAVSAAAPEKSRADMDLIERIGEDARGRYKAVQEKKQEFKKGSFPAALVGTKAVGQAAGLGLDVMGEASVSAFRALPDVIETPIRKGAGVLGGAVMDSAIGTGILKGAEKYQDVKEKHPQAISLLEDVANVGMLLAPVKGKPKTATKEPFLTLGKAGERASKAGKSQIAKAKRDFVEDLVLPKQTAKTIEGQAKKGLMEDVGLFQGKRAVKLDKFQSAMADEVSKVPMVSKNRTILNNQNIVRKFAWKEAEILTKKLEESGIIFPKKEYKSVIEKNLIKLINTSHVLVGDAGATAERLVNQFYKIIDDVPSTPSGLLEARKAFDQLAIQSRKNVFNPDVENAFSEVISSIRNTTNDFIAQKAPDVTVKSALKKQHLLFSAADNMAAKVSQEGGSAITRVVKVVENKIPLKSEAAKLLALGGAGAAGAQISPVITIIGGALYVGDKVVRSATAKKALGQILKATDKVIKTTTDKKILQQLRADRAIILEMTKTLGEDKGKQQ